MDRTRLVRVGDYIAEVNVELIVTDDEWSPYLRLEDAYKLDDVREALQRGDAQAAASYGRVFRLVPVVEA
ncbi:MAG: hypothetical protein HZB53_10350 [Chloroflexi bacterium]|nr:hypothetical protein [Chloroflexota bacterium]